MSSLAADPTSTTTTGKVPEPESFFVKHKDKLGTLKVLALAEAVEKSAGKPIGKIRSGPDGALYRYDDGIYRGDGEELVRHGANIALRHLTRSAHVNEVVTYFKNREGVDPLSFDPPRGRAIYARNGIFHLSGDFENPIKEHEDYTPENAWLAQLPWDYIPDAPEPPRLMKFLQDVFVIRDEAGTDPRREDGRLYPGAGWAWNAAPQRSASSDPAPR